MKTISLETLAELLPAPSDEPGDEAWELRWLISECNLSPRILVEIKEKSVRMTFPTNNTRGRGRIWLSRHNGITSADICAFIRLCESVANICELPLWVPYKEQQTLHAKGFVQFLKTTGMILDPKPKPPLRGYVSRYIFPEE